MLLSLFEPYRSLSDAFLIERIIGGEEMAFAYILIEHCGPRFKFLVHKSCYRELNFTLDELTNEVAILLKHNDFRDLCLFRGLDGATPCSLKTYITVIANRFLSRKLRKFLQEKQSFGTQVPLCESIVRHRNDAHDSTRTDILDDFAHLLSTREIDVLRYYKLEKRSVEEVAELLNITVANVYSICSRAIGRLRDILREEVCHD